MSIRPAIVMIAFLSPLAVAVGRDGSKSTWAGFEASPWFDEQVAFRVIEPGVRVFLNAPGLEQIREDRATRIVVFATPNGNTAEQTLGCKLREGMDWHFDIQHIAAQTRGYRETNPAENVVLVCVQPEVPSWPLWRRNHADNAAMIRRVVASITADIPLPDPKITLTCHSGGGSFIFGFINASDTLPDEVDRIVFLDANYGYDDGDKHGDKLIEWLERDEAHRLINIAYDDREITLDGRKVVGPTGGTYRATERMIERFAKSLAIDKDTLDTPGGVFTRHTAFSGRFLSLVHPNPENIILHTRLVGEMNGHLYTLALGTQGETRWGSFGGPRAYSKWIQPEPYDFAAPPVHRSTPDSGTIPQRPPDAPGGRAFMQSIADLSLVEREAEIRRQLLSGNLPSFLRQFKAIRVHSGDHTLVYHVMPDYLAIGSDDDFVRIPMTPMTAQAVADAFGCTLPTRKMVGDIHRHATDKPEPRPLTESREAVATFLQHHAIIESQRPEAALGSLVSGIKKDIVLTNRLADRPTAVALFGWHKLDGDPIQPLTTVHVRTYVDYSHGVRLVRRAMTINGEEKDFRQIAGDPVLSDLVSDEGPLRATAYETRW